MGDGPKQSHDRWNHAAALVGAVFVGLGITSVIVAIIWSLAVSHTRDQIQGERESTHYAERASEQIQERCRSSDPAVQRQCIEEIVTATHENQRDEADLIAQRQMADWAYAMTVISGFSFLLTIAGIYFVRENLIEMQHARKASEAAVELAGSANRLTEKALLLDQRPWVAVDCALDGPITFDKNGCNIPLRFVLQNTSKTPAFYAAVELEALNMYGNINPLQMQMNFAQEKLRRPDKNFGFTISPGGRLEQRIHTSIGNDKIDEMQAWFQKNFDGRLFDFMSPLVYGCVNYKSAIDDSVHQTGFIYYINRHVPAIINGKENLAIARSFGNVPKEHLWLTYWIQASAST